MNESLSADPACPWTNIEPHLDIALADLRDADRDVILLRFFQGKSAHDMGTILGVSEETARKRLSRALDRLRNLLAKRGVTVAATSLAAAISTNAVQSAPIGLSATITTAAALGGSSVGVTAVTAAAKAIAMTTLQKTLITATIVAAVGTSIYEAQRASTLRRHIQSLQQQQASLADQIEQLASERNADKGRLAALNQDNENLNRSNDMAQGRRIKLPAGVSLTPRL